MDNPWQSPEAPLEPQDPPSGPVIPYEEPGKGLGWRLGETLRMILRDPSEAGRRLAATKSVAPAMACFLWLGLPMQWLAHLITVPASIAQQGQANRWVFDLMRVPPPPPPTPEQLALATTFSWIWAVLSPIGIAIGILLMGCCAHLGLWVFKGLETRRGMETTFRALLYGSAATQWVDLPMALLAYIPGFGMKMPHQLLALGVGLGVLSFRGVVIAHAHGARTWKGVLGVLLVPVVLMLLAACCLGGILGAMSGMAGR